MKLVKGKKSNWIKDAEYRLKNRKWHSYSSNIARRILAALENKENFSQKKLATIINVSPQYISKVVKGKENLSLETIAKISEALDTELITFPDYNYNKEDNKIIENVQNIPNNTEADQMLRIITLPYSNISITSEFSTLKQKAVTEKMINLLKPSSSEFEEADSFNFSVIKISDSK
ncbi:helix-turn-helix domain-containing protein [Flavihumibacter sp. RY-1]|jgi:transcriptional regulator with XRE-family HTH domain|uniref:Helix-turn-helix domain-containing protein n=1 Tax=Flavihumibacter fluminis TaxID=2909236 RepID=A0ABS9BJE8_9BACT|nr:helix-turn-helix domain-containing protein [Flavihumibacter fluminis]MCF1715148.1 helix-turn-helix domain-containing protein [Flavihumibacter fluminis]